MNIPVHFLPWRSKVALANSALKLADLSESNRLLATKIESIEASISERISLSESGLRNQLSESKSLVAHLQASDIAHHVTEDCLRSQVSQLQMEVEAVRSRTEEPALRQRIDMLERDLQSRIKIESDLRVRLSESNEAVDKFMRENIEHVRLAQNHQKSAERNRKGVAALINWIEAAHRVSPASPGTIHSALQQMQQNQTA